MYVNQHQLTVVMQMQVHALYLIPFFTPQYSEPTFEKELKQVTESKATGICCNPFTQRTILVICAKEWLVCVRITFNSDMHQDFWGYFQFLTTSVAAVTLSNEKVSI